MQHTACRFEDDVTVDLPDVALGACLAILLLPPFNCWLGAKS